MGCNSRSSYWDFPDPEEASILNFTPNVSFGSQSTDENCVGDLKLGSLGDLNNFVVTLKNPTVAPSSSGSYKKARAHNSALQVPSCLVDGCVADLSNCRDYHKRHKVCEGHSKTPRVTIGGQERRFCQQCSRFHSLGEFDDNKRSCRKRLDGHNRRRRKPQSDSLSLNYSKYTPTQQDSSILSYGTQYFRKSALESSSWNDAIKAQNNHLYAPPNPHLNLKTINFSQGYREKQFPFMEGTADSSVHISGSNSSGKMLFPDGLDRVINSGRATSLLSLPRTDTCGFNPSHFVHPPTHSAVPNTSHYSGLAMDSIPVANNSIANMDCPEMIINCPDPCHETQTVSFSWG